MGLFDVTRSTYERHDHTHNTTVVEKRAPTDESVKLLREMERAAQDSVIKSIRVNNCEIDCVIHVHRDVLNHQHMIATIYKLNGSRRTVESRISVDKPRDEIARTIINDVAKDIAVSLLEEPFCKIAGHLV